MNEIVNKCLLAGDKLMHKMHLRQSGFTYSARGPFTKNEEGRQKFKETGDSQYIYQNELNKACFQHDMTYGNFKDLTRRTETLSNGRWIEICIFWHGPFQGKAIYRRNFRGNFLSYHKYPKIQLKVL